jgi:uncharacterized damage-inducible protein DinB
MKPENAPLPYFSRLLRYDSWANAEVATSVRRTPSPRALRWLGHIVGAEHLWLSRLTGHPSPLEVWPELDMDACAARVEELARIWPQYLSTLGSMGLSDSITYRNTKGEVWSSAVADVLTHVTIHSGYHRGQIAAAIREAGGTPAYTDFIHATRQGMIE